jgi:hypothetical protein
MSSDERRYRSSGVPENNVVMNVVGIKTDEVTTNLNPRFSQRASFGVLTPCGK